LNLLLVAVVGASLLFPVVSSDEVVPREEPRFINTVYAEEVPIVATTTPPVVIDELACNCYRFVRSKVPSLPLTKDLKSNLGAPEVGAVVIQRFSSGLMHYAVITEVTGDTFVVKESNYRKCKYTTRTLSTADPHVIGYWKML
jgi:hypothetical protein